ncbi:hypothetical protein [Foetidibacter luteolus]|uniref:hypothetical protein n=1 Tax=Foetidibacter luteolus TaxID=2608880 RepID=UPI00129A5582|nr:hypothetical protein [Foetidibacter luteolus]
MRVTCLLLFCCLFHSSFCQDTAFLKVHFLYGSKPRKAFKESEEKWFGGMLGGHVGIEGDSGKILSFLPFGKFHWFEHKHNRHSMYALHSQRDFYSILGGNGDSVKKAVVYIPVTTQQKKTFDSLLVAYTKETPYDYALVGMRCGAATYDILARLGIMKRYNRIKTYQKIIYPRKLRKRLFNKAANNGWAVVLTEGSVNRKWERDL